MRFKKRASLEISIQAIVIVVLAMTLLGLGLGFIRSMFKSIGSTTEDVTEQVKSQIIQQMITSDQKISFPKTEIVIDKGGSIVLPVGIRNKYDKTLYYKMVFTSVSDPKGNPFSAEGWFQSAQPRDGYRLPAAEAHVRNIKLSVPRTVDSGSYVLTFDVTDEDYQPGMPEYIYDQKDFFIVVRE